MVGILAHGYGLNNENWLEVATDRLRRTLEEIVDLNPKLIIFGTGSTFKYGKVEAQCMQELLLENFSIWIEDFSLSGKIKAQIRKKIEEAVLETESTNTPEEAKFAMKIFSDYKIQKVYVVSSRDHWLRCGKEVELVGHEYGIKVFATSSYKSYSGPPEKVIILESRHWLYNPLQKILNLPKPKRATLVKLLQEFEA